MTKVIYRNKRKPVQQLKQAPLIASVSHVSKRINICKYQRFNSAIHSVLNQ